MDSDRAAIWFELASILPVGVARNADRFAVELPCDLMFEFGTSTLKGADLSQLVSLLSRLGLTPVDRARVSQPVVNTKEANPFQNLSSRTKNSLKVSQHTTKSLVQEFHWNIPLSVWKGK
jgi:hypothetical protein